MSDITRQGDRHAHVRYARAHLRHPGARRRRHPHRRRRPHRHRRRGPPERPGQEGRRDRRRAHPRRVRRRPAARSRPPGAGSPTRSGVAASRSTCRSTCRPARTSGARRAWGRCPATGRLGECRFKIGAGDIQLDRGRAAAAQDRCRRRHRRPRRRPRRGRPPGPAPCGSTASTARRWSRTPTATRGSARSPATCGSPRPTAPSPSTGRRRRWWPRPPAATSASARWPGATSGPRPPTARSRSGSATGVAAWLDLDTSFGTVHNDLDAADGPAPGEDTVEVRARTAFGDITVRRAGRSDAVKEGRSSHRDHGEGGRRLAGASIQRTA